MVPGNRAWLLGFGMTDQASIRGYQDLRVWRDSVELVVETYRATSAFPKTELYGLTSQLRRAAVSIPSNIAEGHGRDGLGDYLYHLSVANGSLMEVETQLLLSLRMNYLSKEVVAPLFRRTSDVGRMLAGLTRKLKARRTRVVRTPST